MRKIGLGENSSLFQLMAIKREGQRGGYCELLERPSRGGEDNFLLESAPFGFVPGVFQPPCQTLIAQHLNNTTIAAWQTELTVHPQRHPCLQLGTGSVLRARLGVSNPLA